MKQIRILVYGYFGYDNNQLDGQTVKTRSIYKLLNKYSDEIDATVSYYDTQRFQVGKLNFLRSLKAILKSNVLFYITARNNLKYLFPIIFIVCKIKNIKIHYVVVGGWLDEYLSKLPLHKFLLKRVKRIYPQTNDLVENLTKMQFNNVEKLHNFRLIEKPINLNIKSKPNKDLKLVYLARIHPKKGVKTIFDLAELLFKLNKNITIDLYGQIQNNYEEEFNKLLELSNDNIRYCGELDPEDITNCLLNYDLFLFPTEYYTEGFPGSILDAYIAQVPVVVTNWKYAEEFVDNNKSGIICEFN